MAQNKILSDLSKANKKFLSFYPGEPIGRQPVHTVYGGAHLFSSELASKMSQSALKTLNEFAPKPESLAQIIGASKEDNALWQKIHSRVVAKLQKEAVEDFRIDFEDGYGIRADEEEDGHAGNTAAEMVKGMKDKSLPPFIGIRIKPLTNESMKRSLRTLDLVISGIVNKTKGKLPDGFVITLPKITITEQSTTLTKTLEDLEKKLKLRSGTLKFEIMVETTQSVLNEIGQCPLREFVSAGKGRCIGAHFGTYDYTAGNGITAAYQTMAHSACDFAKHMMKVSLTGTGIMLSDGATNVMPVGNSEVVHRAWKLSYDHIRHSMINGFYQGWDLHPAQLPIRYAAVYYFFLESLDSTTQRLKSFVEKAARATLLGDVFDDAATGQGLLNFFLRGLSCGAISEKEAIATGLTLNEIYGRSFMKILEGRK